MQEKRSNGASATHGGLLALLVAAALCLPHDAVAQQAEDHVDDHHAHPNHLSVFLGAATPKKNPSDTSFALGVEYERQLNDWVGIGGMADFLFGDFNRNALLAGTVYIHPHLGDLVVLVAPGAEWVETLVLDGESTKLKTKTYAILRLGVGYRFHIGSASVAPTFEIDFIGESKTTFSYGVALGYGF